MRGPGGGNAREGVVGAAASGSTFSDELLAGKVEGLVKPGGSCGVDRTDVDPELGIGELNDGVDTEALVGVGALAGEPADAMVASACCLAASEPPTMAAARRAEESSCAFFLTAAEGALGKRRRA